MSTSNLTQLPANVRSTDNAAKGLKGYRETSIIAKGPVGISALSWMVEARVIRDSTAGVVQGIPPLRPAAIVISWVKADGG